MNSLKKSIVSGALGILCAPSLAQAAIPGTSAVADIYQVSITRVELCRTSSCSSPFLMGAGSKTFDIASVTAGHDVGQYVSTNGIPLFQTWSHVRVTISTTISIAGEGTDNGAQACRTVTGQASGNHTGTGTGTVGAGQGTLQDLVIPNDTVGGMSSADYTTSNLTKVAGSSTATILYPLSSPYTSKEKAPRIEVKFNTGTALGLFQTGAGTCGVFPRPPVVTITASDPT